MASGDSNSPSIWTIADLRVDRFAAPQFGSERGMVMNKHMAGGVFQDPVLIGAACVGVAVALGWAWRSRARVASLAQRLAGPVTRGRARATSADAVEAPLSGRPCVAYHWSAYEHTYGRVHRAGRDRGGWRRQDIEHRFVEVPWVFDTGPTAHRLPEARYLKVAAGADRREDRVNRGAFDWLLRRSWTSEHEWRIEPGDALVLFGLPSAPVLLSTRSVGRERLEAAWSLSILAAAFVVLPGLFAGIAWVAGTLSGS